MATYKYGPNTFQTATLDLVTPGTVTVDPEAYISPITGDGSGIDLESGVWAVTMNGTVNAVDNGIYFISQGLAKNSHLTVGIDGTIFASDPSSNGILMKQAVDIVNSGLIAGGQIGINAQFGTSLSKGYTVTNNATGSIVGGETGILSNNAQWTLTLKNAGTIEGLTSGISGGAVLWKGAANITNSGTIIGDLEVINPTTLASSITNTGSMSRIVILSDGNDTVKNSGFISELRLGGGKNTLTNSGEIQYDLTAGSGDDSVVNSGFLDAFIYLNNGNNHLTNSGTIAGDINFGSGNDIVGNTKLLGGNVTLGDGNNTLTNGGTIQVDVTAGTGKDTVTNTKSILGSVVLGDGLNHLTNSGTIGGDATFGTTDDVVGNTGSISGAVVLGNGNNTLTNGGTIGNGVSAGTGDDSVTNTKSIVGAVVLGGGGNHFTNSGTVDGSVTAGGGIDIFKNTGILSSGSSFNLGAGNDSFTGGNSAETIQGAAGNDVYSFGGGDDTLIVPGSENFTLDGGLGNDHFDASAASVAYSVNLGAKAVTVNAQTLQAATAFTTAGHLGGGIKGFEIIDTGSGGDVVIGSAGADVINTGSGADFLAGGLGRDLLTGGTGADTFILFTLQDSGTTKATRDVVKDFEVAGDKFDLSAIDANTKQADNQAFNWIGKDTPFLHAGDLRAVTEGGDTILQGDVNGDGKADFSIDIVGVVNLGGGNIVV